MDELINSVHRLGQLNMRSTVLSIINKALEGDNLSNPVTRNLLSSLFDEVLALNVIPYDLTNNK